MKTIVSTIALVSAMSTAAFAGVQNTFTVDADGSVGIQTVHTLDVVGPSASEGLYLLATTGSGDVRAEEGFGKSYHHTGGKPGAFTYEIDTPWMAAAEALLGEGEFLAPHFLVNWSGDIDIMVAPHLLVDGKVMHGAGPDDSFIRISADRVNAFYTATFESATIDGVATGSTDAPDSMVGPYSLLDSATLSAAAQAIGVDGGSASSVVNNGQFTVTGSATTSNKAAADFAAANIDAVNAAIDAAIADGFEFTLDDGSYTVEDGQLTLTVTNTEGGKADLIVSISGAKRFDYSADVAK